MPVQPDPGYGPNGERIDGVGLIAWSANPPPESYTPVDDIWLYFALGESTIPWISQSDDEGWPSVYLGGVFV